LDEFSLPKFYLLFGISKVKSAAVTAFRSSYRHAGDRWLGHYSPMDRERLSLTSLEVICDALLEIVEVRTVFDFLQFQQSTFHNFFIFYLPFRLV
jgi:neurofibromin 1